jgi:hypothetical protein
VSKAFALDDQYVKAACLGRPVLNSFPMLTFQVSSDFSILLRAAGGEAQVLLLPLQLINNSDFKTRF